MEGKASVLGLCTPFLPYSSSAHGVMLSRDRPTLLKIIVCAHHFFFYFFTSSDGSAGTTAVRAVPPRSIMAHHGFRSKEARPARKQNVYYSKQRHTPHIIYILEYCWAFRKCLFVNTIYNACRFMSHGLKPC